MKEQLFRLSLQFFGDAPEDSDEDFEDDFFDDDEEEEESGEDLGGGDDTEEEEKENDPEEEEKADEDGADADSADGAEPEDEKSALISELKALGYVGDDLASLASDMKKKREGREAQDKSRERRETNAEGKAHIKSSRPGKSATGGASSAFTERQVSALAERTGCSKERARSLLSHHMTLMNGG